MQRAQGIRRLRFGAHCLQLLGVRNASSRFVGNRDSLAAAVLYS